MSTNSNRTRNKPDENRRLSSFSQRLQSLSDSFYSTILQDSKEDKIPIKNAEQLAHLQTSTCGDDNDDDFTFDQCSTSRVTSNDDFSFTFHSIDQSNTQIYSKYQKTTQRNHSSTPKDNSMKKNEDETIVLEENSSSHSHHQPMIIGYYPVITYQPICLPPPLPPSTIYLSNKQIQSQSNHYSTFNQMTPRKIN